MKLIPLAVLAVTLSVIPAFGSKKAGNRPYVQSMDPTGPSVFYAKGVPTGGEGSLGTTKIFRVKADADELVDSYDWYSPRGVILGWSPIAGKVAAMSFGESDPNPDVRLEFAFHIGGKLLHSYSTSDLKTLGVEVGADFEGGVGARYKTLGCIQVPNTNEYDFVIESSGGLRLSFDILTGKPRPK